LKKNILFIVPYPHNTAPSQRLKFEQYYPEFERLGFNITSLSFVNKSFQKIIYKKGFYITKAIFTIIAYFKRYFALIKVNKYDVVYIHLWGTPLGLPIYEWCLRKLSKKLIYDIDDLVYLGKTSQNNRFLAILKGKMKPIYLMKYADHVITCTPYLDAFVKNYNHHTTDISSTINTTSYIPINTYHNDHELIIGWSGSHSTSQYLYLLKNVFIELQKHFSFRLLVMGDADFDIPGLSIEAIAWKEEWEVSTLQKMDIGVYPLPHNEEWVLGKSGLKALQYMALGIPTIATNVGCNNRVIENGTSGFLVDNEQEWLEKLKLLFQDAQLRKKIGMQARSRVEKKFSITATAPIYLKVFNSL